MTIGVLGRQWSLFPLVPKEVFFEISLKCWCDIHFFLPLSLSLSLHGSSRPECLLKWLVLAVYAIAAHLVRSIIAGGAGKVFPPAPLAISSVVPSVPPPPIQTVRA